MAMARQRGMAMMLASVLTVIGAGPGAARDLQGRVSVLDGDTIEMHGQRIRLHGIDAPEGGQRCIDGQGRPWRCGTEAARALDAMTQGRVIACRQMDRDRYGRIVARCQAGGMDLGAEMVRQGLAVAYRRYSTAYIVDEDRARGRRVGMWSGSFEMPQEWRRRSSNR